MRLFVLFSCIAFSFGGFTFYAAVVIPIGSDVLDSTTQGFVTQRVTDVLNIGNSITLAIYIWYWLTHPRITNPKLRPPIRWTIALIIAFASCLVVLFIIHPKLDVLLIQEDFLVAQPQRFYALHQIYLWASTILWFCHLGLIWQIVTSIEPTTITSEIQILEGLGSAATLDAANSTGGGG